MQLKNIFRLYSLILLYASTIYGNQSIETANHLLANANTRFMQGDILYAHHIYQTLQKQFPQSIALLQNTARSAYELNQNTYAQTLLEQALALQPDNAELHYQYALCLLSAGNYEHGFYHYEWRWKKKDKQHIALPYPKWNGESLANKHILLVSEGDFGDVFQFIRFAQKIKTNNTIITLLTKTALVQFMQHQPYLDYIIDSLSGQTFDYWTSLMSIPAIINSTQSSVGTITPYLYMSQEIKHHNAQYIQKDTYNIGICWNADATNDANRPPHAQRSIGHQLQQACTMDGITIYPLHQQAFGHTFDVTHGSFVDSAGLICNLDLIITVDTAIAHLAGGLGKPTWVLLPQKADWRWMLERSDSPWYNSMKLFRNTQATDWKDLCSYVRTQLLIHIQERMQ